MIPGIKFAQYNNLASVEELVNDKTCAIIFETVQGEGGIYPAKPEFIKGVRKLCDEKGILLILDEIQCGMGRTGTMFAYEQYGVKPDILTVAKALGCGVPVGAFLATELHTEAIRWHVPQQLRSLSFSRSRMCSIMLRRYQLILRKSLMR